MTPTTDTIPLVDLKAQHEQVADEIHEGFARVMASGSYVLGDDVAAFEREFAHFSGAAHCVGVANGTDALELALRAAGVAPGDEVILPTNSFIATAEAVARAGATPVLVDADRVHLLLDVEQVAGAVNDRTTAIVPVHLYGQLAPMEDIATIASRAGLAVVEDAAQAQGATRNGGTVGSFSDAASTSFYPAKNLGAYGDGGAVLTNSDELARSVRSLGNHGSTVKYEHPELGFNSRLDSLQAVVLRAKLARLGEWNRARRAAADRYHLMLADVPDVEAPATLPGNEHVWHLYVIRVPSRDRVLAALNKAGIGAGIHYPVPIHLQGAFSHLGHARGDFPVAEAAANEILSLPLFPGITPTQQDWVVAALLSALD